MLINLVFFLILFGEASFSQEYEVEAVRILGDQEAFQEPGSIYQISEEEIERRGTSNPHVLLQGIPGVTFQVEDGMGLRPNIGLRGTHPNRSKKITILEDGVLIVPAPYSAPSAYYFPLMDRIVGVEVYKGPSSIKYGPNSIGGAINLITRDYTEELSNELDVSYGSYNTLKLGAWTSNTVNNWSWLLEGNRITSDGFSELPNGGDTSLYKNDISLKTRYRFNTANTKVLDFKFNWADEASRETYLGLTDEDFNNNPYQRYEASRYDNMKSDHFQYQLKFFSEWAEDFFTEAILYRNEFHRVWDKLNGFSDNTVSISDVLLNPVGQNEDFLNVLKGNKNSDVSEELRYGINDRKYVSQGLQIENRFYVSEDFFDFGLTFHQDYIERHHSLQDAEMSTTQGVIKKQAFLDEANYNRDKSDALKTYLVYNKIIDKFLIKAGLRVENVSTERLNLATGVRDKANDTYTVPGLGVSYNIDEKNVVFAGVNKGVTLPGPGQSENVAPEEAINYEVGYRTNQKFMALEAVGFLSDYSNILGTCSFSAGCTSTNLDDQYNGGEATIWGLELLAGKNIYYKQMVFPVKLTGTYTNATFDSTIESENKEWGLGLIRNGDPLPYIPELSAALSAGVQTQRFLANLIYNFKSKIYDQSVQEGRVEIPSYGILNLQFNYKVNTKLTSYLNVDNILGEEYVASYRPFGARPGAPFWATVGLRYRF